MTGRRHLSVVSLGYILADKAHVPLAFAMTFPLLPLFRKHYYFFPIA